ncbi:MAG: glycoside hydrolase family 9 protein [Cytophagaceae bacterium]|jgi:hypothetical protein|nr:glycoside hydrolase family 9 protein [Cytophagaceae bacterium]
MSTKFKLTTLLLILLTQFELLAQYWTTNDYKKALWMSTRFYGAQRSGNNNWTLYNHLPTGVNSSLRGTAFVGDADGAYDMSGGWHDCGDHVKFGITGFYSAYMLLKGYAEWPTGYDDKYSFTYNGYNTCGNYTYEGTCHDPNGIPDVLDEMKHKCDYLIKCARDNNNFYYQVGDGDWDHAQWTTAVKMQTLSQNNGGQARPVCKNPGESTQASMVAATLALMSRMYQPYDAAYAALCLTHANYAYNYAKNNKGNGDPSCTEGFYGGNDAWEDNYAIMCSEMYWATNNTAYRTEALQYPAANNKGAGVVGPNQYYTFDYANDGEVALYNMALLGDNNARTQFNNRISGHFMAGGSRNGLGIYNAHGGGWGALRYNANASFLIALYAKLNNDYSTATMNLIYADIDYIMGRNGSKRSYVVGFTPAAGGPFLSPQYPHHRNVYLRDDNPGNATVLTIPTKNQQLGALVGGKRDGTYNDDRSDYVNSEVCVDYNVGLVGALGFINWRLAPVVVGNCRQPNLGPDRSTCNTTLPYLADANAGNPGGAISYRWYTWNGSTKTLISGATNRTYSITSAGSYIVERDSTTVGAPCTKRDTIHFTNSIPVPSLGADQNICQPASYNLAPSNLASYSGATWQWAEANALAGPYTNITAGTNSTLSNVRKAGYYRLTVTQGSCNNNDIIRLTSSLPTPVDGCSASGSIPLSITNAGAGPYQWFTVPTAGSSVATGLNYNAPSAGTYYVQDMSATGGSVGPTSKLTGGDQQWGWPNGNHLAFTISSNVTITSLSVPFTTYATSAGTIAVEVLDNNGNALSPTRIFTSNAATPSCASCGTIMINFTFTNFTIQSAWGTNLRLRIVQPASGSINGSPIWQQGNATYPYNSTPAGVFTITGENGGDGDGNDYHFFYNIQFQTGTPCDRLPVVAANTGCTLPVDWVSVSARRIDNTVLLEWITSEEVNNDYFIVQRSSNGVDFSDLSVVDGSGNSSALQRYSLVDAAPLASTTYYRIAQVDLDGSTDYSAIVSVDATFKNSLVAKPNPFTGYTTIQYISSSDPAVDYVLTTVSGETIEKWTNKGANQEWNIGEGLAPGIYFLTSWDGNLYQTVKLIKQ